jgi:O-6-methylguanine DNA methyltransferase
MEIGYYLSPFGYLKYAFENDVIFQMNFHFEAIDSSTYNVEINKALDAYFSGKSHRFPFTFYINNKTIFQQKVLKALQEIPYGETRSYSEIAINIGHPKAVRAVGQACKNNPVGIMIPCHRVIGKNHKLTGYSGKDYIYLKEKLLNLEKKFIEI